MIYPTYRLKTLLLKQAYIVALLGTVLYVCIYACTYVETMTIETAKGRFCFPSKCPLHF
jgi:hypothetical protein